MSADIGGMLELIDGDRGLCFKAGNAESLKNVLEKIIQNPSILNALPDNRDRVDSIQQDYQTIFSIYTKLLKETK